jgi:FkbM family methyltransferase
LLKKFIEGKRWWYFLPRKIRFKIFNLKFLKKFKTSTGDYFLPFFAFKDRIRNSIIDGEIFDEKIFETIKNLIKPNSIVIDVGANFGQMSILWSKCKPDVEVYSFEASGYVFQILEKNIKINKSNVKPFNYLVGNESNENLFIKKPNLSDFTTYGSNQLKKVDNESIGDIEKVKAIKIDDLKFDKSISVMKIDVQGYDLEVLKGAKNTINKHKMPIVFEYEKDFENKPNYNFDNFKRFIENINYKIDHKIDDTNYLILPK